MKTFALGLLVSAIVIGISTIAYNRIIEKRVYNLNCMIEEMYEKQARDRYTIRNLYAQRNTAWIELNRVRRNCNE